MNISPINAGKMLLAGSVGLLVTMFFHPPGGNIEYLIKTSTVIVASHSVAILSIPFFLTGFGDYLKYGNITLLFQHCRFL